LGRGGQGAFGAAQADQAKHVADGSSEGSEGGKVGTAGGSNELSLSLQLATLFTGRDAGEVTTDSFAPEAEEGP
jgi:hypothetical protein